ncbi:MAG: hypothetical protein ACNYZH_04685 [Acidimicrobiia bacterium]
MRTGQMRARVAVVLLALGTLIVATPVIAYTTVASEVFTFYGCTWDEKIQDGNASQKARMVGNDRAGSCNHGYWITDTDARIQYDESTSCNSPTWSSWQDGLFDFYAYAANTSTYACQGQAIHQVYDGQYYHNSGNIIYSGR